VLTTEFPSRRYPTGAVTHLREYPEIVHGEMFNSFFWGGYLEFALAGTEGIFDAEFYNVELWRDFQTMDEPGSAVGEDAFTNTAWLDDLPLQHPLNRIPQN